MFFCCFFCCQSYSIKSTRRNCKKIKTLEELVPSTATRSTETRKAPIMAASWNLKDDFPFFLSLLKYGFIVFFSEFIFLSVFFFPHFPSALIIFRNPLCNLQTLSGGHGHNTKRDYYLTILKKSGNLIKSSPWNCLYLLPLPPVSVLTTILLFFPFLHLLQITSKILHSFIR